MRRGLQRLVRSWGFQVLEYPSGSECLDSLAHDRPDCVILDLHMPGVDGYEVLERLARSGSRIPVIVVTGRDTTEAREKTARLGARFYFSKPIDSDCLHQAILDSVGPNSNKASAPGGEDEESGRKEQN